MAFWIIGHRKAKKGHAIENYTLIKLFSTNYARDLIYQIQDGKFDDYFPCSEKKKKCKLKTCKWLNLFAYYYNIGISA